LVVSFFILIFDYQKQSIMENKTFDNFVDSYLATAEWVTVDGSTRGFTKKAKTIAKNECTKFVRLMFQTLTKDEANAILKYQGNDLGSLAGHDFFLTRNRHGAGFWDNAIYNELANEGCNRLTELSHKLGEANVYENRGYLNFD
jgi:hypothetical protein